MRVDPDVPRASVAGVGSLVRRVAAASLALLIGTAPASAEYLLRPGDEVEIGVSGLSESKSRTVIGIDGMGSIPLAGYLKADGLTLPEFRTLVQDTLSVKNVRRLGVGGQEMVSAIDRDEVAVSIVSFRPVYLSGDISKPGEQGFRPGMTVRQAISIAGGFDIMRIRMDNPFLAVIDQKSEYETLRAEHMREAVRVARLEAELGGAADFTGDGLDLNGDPELKRAILSLERQRFVLRRDDLRKERLSLSRRLDLGRKQGSDLQEQVDKEREGVQSDTAEYNRMADLLSRGAVVAPRVTEARRSLLLSSTRLLQTTVQAAATQREVQEVSRKLEKLEDSNRLDIASELQDAKVKLEGWRSRLAGIGQKLVYTGMVKSQLVRDNAGRAEITIMRQGPGGQSRLRADEDTPLDPGDVVDVSLQSSYFQDPRPAGRDAAVSGGAAGAGSSLAATTR